MDLGVHVVNFTLPGAPSTTAATLAEVGAAADAVGVRDLTLMDHFFQLEMMGMDARQEMLDGYTALGFLAGKTEHVRLSLLVTGVTYRHPGLLAKIVTTVDVLSGGRSQLGIGAAWYEREHAGLGVPFPSVRERLERLEEAVRICLQMWSDDDGPFEGKHYRLAETISSPQPVQKPRPPILVAGMGERVLLRIVARHADACNLFSMVGPDGIAAKLDILRRHCDAEKRDYGAIRKTMLWMGVPPAQGADTDFLKEAAAYARAGIQEINVMPLSTEPAAWVEGLRDTIERMKSIG